MSFIKCYIIPNIWNILIALGTICAAIFAGDNLRAIKKQAKYQIENNILDNLYKSILGIIESFEYIDNEGSEFKGDIALLKSLNDWYCHSSDSFCQTTKGEDLKKEITHLISLFCLLKQRIKEFETNKYSSNIYNLSSYLYNYKLQKYFNYLYEENKIDDKELFEDFYREKKCLECSCDLEEIKHGFDDSTLSLILDLKDFYFK